MREPHPRVVLGLHRSRYERQLLTSALELGITAIDTSFNYRDFGAHRRLTEIGGDLLPHLTLSTKVGFFPGTGRAEHSLDPGRLRLALEQTNRDLRRVPDLVFLHNPERSLREAPDGRDMLAQACATLDDATAQGLCRSWGISSWDPSSLPNLIDPTAPKPSVLMVRAGLLVGIRTLDTADDLATRWGLPADSMWGMSPFGGDATDPVWEKLDPRVFLRNPRSSLSRPQAAFRAAYHLPRVGSVAVGSDDSDHLRELLAALDCPVDDQVVSEYRDLLLGRASRQPA
ncbi:aldo/keto reductase [Kitasatospora sp. NBC_01287]|uniref:aldo/keto reductase n=1 Tax=Kitasatospora sp. NBC_01287 TaxID=2903573 RepID=UPI00225674BD|nr:aldo/keto reductase [Kitasatospora sp. NBC_01287]MCX4751170.1 aldo/keto reductase [Kitasatospora sp. NBC_01287]